MSYGRVLENIFGSQFEAEDTGDFVSCLDATNSYLDEKLESFKESPDDNENQTICPSKIVVWDIDSTDNMTNLVKISKDRLTLLSQSAFSTLKANCCVFSGKYMYEVQLKSKGVMQIGFCSAQCRFTQDTGVGDTKHSYGLDGSKKRLWHVYTKNYGPYWRSGDIFGVCLDMDNGTIEYYRNGTALGIAFEDLERGPGLALFPAVSLAFNDSLTANFGGSPFRYPVSGYRPLQSPPLKLLYQADQLLQYLVKISYLISSNVKLAVPKSSSDISLDSFYMFIVNIIVERIVPLLLNSYVVEEKVLRIIRNLCVLKSTSNSLIQPGEPGSTLEALLTLLWTNLEDAEVKIFLKRVLNYLSNAFKETPTDLEYENQRKIIVILTCLCNHTQTRKYFLEFKFFRKNCLPLFLYIKPPDESTLELLLPDDAIWTEGLGGEKSVYLDACEKLKSYTSILYYLQKKLIMTLLNNTDGSDDSPSSRKIFMNRFRSFTLENLSSSFTTTTQPAIGLSLLCLILDVAKQLHDSENTQQEHLTVDHRFFYDGSLTYGQNDRVGGVLSHLNKVFKKDLQEALGGDHEPAVQAAESSTNFFQGIYSTMFLVSNNDSGTYSLVRNVRNDTNHDEPVSSGNIDNHKSICELVDCCIMFYYSVAYKYVVMIADLRDNISHLSNILIETKHCRDEVLKNLEDFKNSIEGVSSAHDEVLRELSERFLERKNIFAVSW
jgi:Kip1 ubiquitination-promoting complex protein 1